MVNNSNTSLSFWFEWRISEKVSPLTSSFILMLGTLSSAVFLFGPSILFNSPSPTMSSFIFAPSKPESFTTSDAWVFRHAAALRGTLGFGSLGTFGALGCLGSFGSLGFAVLLAGAFTFPAVDGSPTSLVGAFCFESGGLHSSVSSSLLAVWLKDLNRKNAPNQPLVSQQ